MSPPTWAYQVDNFNPPPDDELICSVCQCVFADPVQSPCNHVFCRSCIIKWLENSRNCPICRKRTTRYSLQEVLPLIKNMIMKLILHCRNLEQGCKEKFSLESCESHLKNCIYETVKCKNKPCKEMLLRKDMADHEQNNCPHRYISCETCCLKISSKTTEKHDCIKALKKELKTQAEKVLSQSKKIKELEQEVKNLKKTESSSDSSSLDSLSAAEIMINLSSSVSSVSSPRSYIDSSDTEYEEPNNWISTDEILGGLESNYNRLQDAAQNPTNESVELPRDANNSTIEIQGLDSSLEDDEPHARRPNKRRFTSRTLSSSNDEDDLELPPVPSPKRTWRLPRGQDGSSSSGTHSSPSYSPGFSEGANAAALDTAAPSCSTAAPVPNPQPPFKLRPKLTRKSRTLESRENAATTGTVFQRTLSLLERSNLESDPEWLPPSLQVDDTDTDSDLVLHISSDSTSSDDDSSFEGESNRRSRLGRLFSSSSSEEDPDWLPN